MTGYTDMRRSSMVCALSSKISCAWIHSNSLFLFCGKRRDRIKAILHEPDGMVLLYKRLTVKGHYEWPRNKTEVRDLTWRQFDWLMSGLKVDQPKALQKDDLALRYRKSF
ncbi:MAG: IS66 family insertion sequence element accessory protein TnpB [bacterium LCO1.1]|uniref:IS66 family insertion sequence element accessory protein TnpB n=1 Tax=Candidatus Weimeria bifida TaxID=2599074 RepID=A0A6N7IYB2_9FIRM|nr:IS66 family insertion sequence element accessory protein TnpB [Candidatus Weimeria bifida]